MKSTVLKLGFEMSFGLVLSQLEPKGCPVPGFLYCVTKKQKVQKVLELFSNSAVELFLMLCIWKSELVANNASGTATHD